MELPLNIHNTSGMPRYFWHPSVVYIPDGLGGHNWWMAQTPFPPCEINPYRDRFELPCIHYSNDGINWKPVNNPIDDLTKEQVQNKDFMSDPHLIYVNGQLELFYRLSLRIDERETHTILFKKTSKNGYDWSEKTIVADLRISDQVAIWGDKIISPAIVWNGQCYECYYVDASHYVTHRNIRKVASKDGIHWMYVGRCELKKYEDTPWHIDVQLIDGTHHLICYGDPSGAIVHMTSVDGLHFGGAQEILRPSSNKWSFYSGKLYRSCMVKYDNMYRIYFSGANKYHSYIGLVTTEDWRKFEFVGPKMNWQYTIDTLVGIWRKILRNKKLY